MHQALDAVLMDGGVARREQRERINSGAVELLDDGAFHRGRKGDGASRVGNTEKRLPDIRLHIDD